MIECFPILFANNEQGMDLCVHSEKATVMDFCQAVERFITENNFRRQRAIVATCEGCDICCQERIPLTSVDIYKFKENLFPELLLDAFLKRYTYVSITDRVVDIYLARDIHDQCIFLDKNKKCKAYLYRPFTCQTYLCIRFSNKVAKLREYIVNSGEDELVRMWLQLKEPIVHEAYQININPQDYPESIWTGKRNYQDILLKDIVSQDFWEELCRK